MTVGFGASVPLWQQLQAVSQALVAVRRGASGTAALEAVAVGLRPGVQALLFQVLRQLGRAQALRAHKPVYFRSAGDYVSTAVYKRDLLKNGNLIQGPALIEEHASTTVVQPGDTVRVDPFGNLQISIGSDRS